MPRVILLLAAIFSLVFFGFLIHSEKNRQDESEESDEVG